MNQSNRLRPLTAPEAASLLGVKVETLYAYVSRGRLRSIAVAGSRQRQYRPEDIEAFRAARDGPTEPQTRGDDTSIPLVASSICLIEDGRLYYRGRDAVRLSDTATLEEIADLLWGTADNGARIKTSSPVPAPHPGPLPAAAGRGRDPRSGRVRGRRGPNSITGPIERCRIRLAGLGAEAPADTDLTRGAVTRRGREILHELIGCIAGTPPDPVPAHRQLAAHWGLDAAGADLVRRCLVLLADHELNASTLVARCVASTGAPPCSVVSAALAALSGPRHGGAASRAEAMFHDLKASGDPIAAMAARLARGDTVPGIGHPLYPAGDPRAVAILYAVSTAVPQARRFVGWRPNVDFALAAATTALDLPPGAALALFVVARTVGWIAHAIEQYESGVPIRPRARYTGPRPEPPETQAAGPVRT